jgi:hypothetical protein
MTAAMLVLEPIFEADLPPVGGCEPARKSGCEAALLNGPPGESVLVGLLR